MITDVNILSIAGVVTAVVLLAVGTAIIQSRIDELKKAIDDLAKRVNQSHVEGHRD
jgi:outer membrane murein-binding lipoprotein Lpp